MNRRCIMVKKKLMNLIINILITFGMIRKDRNVRHYAEKMKNYYCNMDLSNKYEIREGINLLKGFVFDKVQLIKKANCNHHSVKIVLISVMRDEKNRINVFLNHYRDLGIKLFVIIDNDSKDGTLEILKEQEDVEVYSVESKFAVGRKEGWINRMFCIYGYNRWYLYVDADELLDWPQRERYNLYDVLNILEKNKINRAGALMIDMYTKKKLFHFKFDNFRLTDFYFDYNKYYLIKDGNKHLYTGGPRKRIFDIECWLSKYPLFYLNKEDIYISSHYLYPYHNFKQFPFIFALLHFKFLTGEDLKKVMDYVKERNHTNNSMEYKHYLKNYLNRNNKFYDERFSIRYQSSSSLSKIKCIKNIIEDFGLQK